MKLILLVSLILTSCFKTAEQIKREKNVDRQLSQSSKIIADLRIEIQELRTTLAQASGQIEEIDHKTQTSGEQTYQSMSEKITQLSEQVKNLSDDNQATQKQMAQLQSEMQQQKKFLGKVTGTLSEMSGKSAKGLLTQAHQAFEKNQQKKAKELYSEVLNRGKISNATKNKVYFNLGLLEFWAKNYDQSLIYFSKIYTKYPRSSKAPGSLFYIGMNFKKKKELEKARATFEELIQNYSKSSFAKKAKKEMK